MRSLIRIGACLLGLVVATATARAACDDLVVDGANVIGNVSRVHAAAERLVSQGTMVRVRTIAGTVGNMDDYAVNKLRTECPSWRTPDGSQWRGNFLLLTYAPNDGGKLGAYYGALLRPRIGESKPQAGDSKWIDVFKTNLVPAIRLYKAGERDALTTGYVSTLAGLQGLLAAPARANTPSNGPTTVTVVQPTDYSGLWTFLKLLLGLIIAVVAVVFFMKYRAARARRQAVIDDYETKRGVAISSYNEVSDPVIAAIFESKIAIEQDAFKKKAMQADLAAYQEQLRYAGQRLQSLGVIPMADTATMGEEEARNSAYNLDRSIFRPIERLVTRLKTHDYEDETETAVAERKTAERKEREYRQRAAERREEEKAAERAQRQEWQRSFRREQREAEADRVKYPAPPARTETITRSEPSYGGSSGPIFAPIIIGSGNTTNNEAPSRRSESHSESSRSDDSGGSLRDYGSSDSGGSFMSDTSSDTSSSSDAGGSFSTD